MLTSGALPGFNHRNRLGGRGQSRALQAQQHRPERISHFVRRQRDAATVPSEYIFEMELQQALEPLLKLSPAYFSGFGSHLNDLIKRSSAEVSSLHGRIPLGPLYSDLGP